MNLNETIAAVVVADNMTVLGDNNSGSGSGSGFDLATIFAKTSEHFLEVEKPTKWWLT